MDDSSERTQLLDEVDETETEIDVSRPHGSDGGSSSAPKAYTYEEAISRTGYGSFHYVLLILCGWALSSDAIEVLSISFVLPPATCDLKLSTSDKGWLTAIIFAGMMVGSFVWGVLADKFGRRAVLLWSLMVNGLGALSSSFAQNFFLFLFLRFVSGIGVGGSMPVVFSYFTEFQPKMKRGSMISVLATFWMSGNIVAAGLAWLIIPHTDIGVKSPNFTYNSWRIFLAVCAFPSISSALGFACMPESPKFLIKSGNTDKALQVLRRMFIKNNPGKKYSDYEVTEVQSESRKGFQAMRSDEFYTSNSRCSRIWYNAKEACTVFTTYTATLYKPPLTKISIILTIIYFTLSFGYYGMFLWFPELFSRIEKYGGTPCSLHNVTELNNSTSCDVSNSIFFEGFLTAVANLPGNILTILIIDRINRNVLLAASMVISGISVFFIVLVKNKIQSIVMSCIFSGISVMGWNALDVIGMELFPTNLRSTANGVMMSLGRVAAILGNLAFGQLVDVYCAVPMILIATLLSIGGLTALKLPSRADADLS